jgi:hypothetical protein
VLLPLNVLRTEKFLTTRLVARSNHFERIWFFAFVVIIDGGGNHGGEGDFGKAIRGAVECEERERLEKLIWKGKSPALRLLKARILLKADVSEAGNRITLEMACKGNGKIIVSAAR